MRLYSRVKSLRKVHEPLMQITNKLFIPRRSELAKERKFGDQYVVSIFDSAPSEAARKFSIGYTGQVIEKGVGDQWWLNFELPRQELMKVDDIKKYLQNFAVQMRSGFDRSTFYRVFHRLMKDASVTHGIMTSESDDAKDRVVFTPRDPWEHYFAVDQYGDVDCDFFRLEMTIKTLTEKFGEKTLPKLLNKRMDPLKGDPLSTVEVILGVFKNGSVRYKSVDPTDKPYIAFYITAGSDTGKMHTLLGKDGRIHRPVTLRIGERTDSGIPITMAADALTSAIIGNTLSKHKLKASHIGVEPPATVSASLKDQVLLNKLNPNSKTFLKDPTDRIEFLTTKVDYARALDAVLRENEVVDAIFYIPFIQMLTRRDKSVKTLGEIYAMLEEQLGLMGPVVESTEDDGLEPAVDIIAEHESSRLPKMPQQLLDYINEEGIRDERGPGRKITLKNKYMGRLQRLKRSLPQAKSAIEQIAVMKEYKDIFPDSLIIIDERRTLERILDGRGFPRDEFKTDRMLAQIDAEIQRRRQFEEEMQFAERAAKIIPSVTKDAVDQASPAALAITGETP